MFRNKLAELCLVLVLVSVLTILGCAGPGASPTTSPTVGPTTSPTGAPATTAPPVTTSGPYGELRMALASFMEERLDPTKVSLTGGNSLCSPMFDYMIRRNGAELVPGVFDKWELAPDGSYWTFSVHHGIKFQNGEDLTAADVKYSFERYTAKDSYYADLTRMINRVEIIDDYTVRVYTIGKQPYFIFYITGYPSGQGFVQPKDYIEQNGADYFDRNPVGSGPFKFVRQIRGDAVEYEALNTHWRQVPSFKKLSLILMPEETTRVAVLKTGQADVIEIDLQGAKELEDAGYRAPTLAGETCQVQLHGAYDPKAIASRLPITDIKVRQALSLAINREEIIKTYFYGKATLAGPPYLSQVNSHEIDWPYWAEYTAKLYRYDPDEAKRLLKEAGYPDGFTFKLFLFDEAGVPYTIKLGEIVQAYWKRIGVNAESVVTDWTYYRSIRNELTAPTIIGQADVRSLSQLPGTASRLNGPVHSAQWGAILNKAFPEVDKLIDDTLTEIDAAKRKEMVAKLVKIISDSYVALPIAIVQTVCALGPKVDINFVSPTTTSVAYYAEIAKHRK